MSKKFLYVFSKEQRDKMLALHYKLLRSDDDNEIYIFENNGETVFDRNDIYAVPSNTLSF